MNKKFKFHKCKKRNIEMNFNGGEITSDSGLLLLKECANKTGLIRKINSQIIDKRENYKVKHSIESLLSQRVFALCLGYEDLNDHNFLKNDTLFQTACNSDTVLASSSTLCRFENNIDDNFLLNSHKVFLEHFISSYKTEPKEITLDFDGTDDTTYGKQEGSFYNSYYKSYCFFPLYVFCDSQLLVSYLRPSNVDGAKHSWAILSLLVKYIKKFWKKTKIILRADAGFSRHKIMNWCERNNVDYVIGLPQNSVLQEKFSSIILKANKEYESTGCKSRFLAREQYKAESWKRDRKVIAKAEHNDKGSNFRCVTTNLKGSPEYIYDQIYCGRGDMENRIKEQKIDMFSGRTSCTKWRANQFRLLLSSIAYILLDFIRNNALKHTIFRFSSTKTIRLKLLKIGATVYKSSKKIKVFASSSYPYKSVFETAFNYISTV